MVIQTGPVFDGVLTFPAITFKQEIRLPQTTVNAA
jgi:hypothetical protein